MKVYQPQDRFAGRTALRVSLPLQMSLYFNVWYSVCWLPAKIGLFIWRVHQYPIPWGFQLLQWCMLALWFFVECFRLYVGYHGSLYEKVPHLVGLVLVNLTLQGSLCYFFGWCGKTSLRPQVPDHALAIVMAVFLTLQVFLAGLVLRRLVRRNTIQFYLNLPSNDF
mmetsp:Transcript_72312/g.127444  ORF Transcript_72312/g.127444 Transcript_72312/m.127444 type:complete len:166 (-) Transcript_72312:493-990(-)